MRLSKKALWISLGGGPEYADNSINPWQLPVETESQNQDMKEGTGLLMLRRTLTLGHVTKGSICATALGVFDIYINGYRVGHPAGRNAIYDEMKPGWTDYSKRVFEYSYDISAYLKDGDNVILAIVAPGWYQGRISVNTYGKHPCAFIASVSYTDDSGNHLIVTGRTWKATYGGPILSSDIWDGEIYDSTRKNYHDISKASYDDSGWMNAVVLKGYSGRLAEKTGPYIRAREQFRLRPVKTVKYSEISKNGTDFGTIIPNYISSAENHFTIRKGEVAVFDFGQNIVGWPIITVKAKRGTRIKVRFAEMLNDTGSLSRGNDGPAGTIYTTNYRSAKSKLYYIASGRISEKYHPSFVFFGFRYAEVSADRDFDFISIRGEVVGSDIERTGMLSTSDREINRLYSNIIWGQRGNYLSIPTDCPQRDERFGWTGDTQIFAPAAAYNGNVYEFFRKWLVDARDSQKADGEYTDVIPRTAIVGAGNGAWGDAGIIVPYIMYMMYGNKKIIEEHYDSMEKYMDWLDTTDNEGPGTAYGDWLAFEPTDSRYISVAYYAHDADLMNRMSLAIGKDDRAIHYKKVFNRVKKHFNEKYLGADNDLTEKTQTAYLIALSFGLVSKAAEKVICAKLREKIEKNGYKLSTGFVGTGIICQTLSEFGMNDLAYSILMQTQNPSWLYSVRQGATTVWERWDSYTKEKGFGDVHMNSFNHYAYGAVCEWMYRYMLGIRPDPDEPGFRKVILKPLADDRTVIPAGQKRLLWASGSYESGYGKIASSWHIFGSSIEYSFDIPDGVEATFVTELKDRKNETFTLNDDDVMISDYTGRDGKMKIRLEPGRNSIILWR